MLDPDLMTDDYPTEDSPSVAFATLAAIVLIFAAGFGFCRLVAWL